MSSSSNNRPKPSVGTGQQRVDTAVESRITKASDIVSDTTAANIVAANMDEIASGSRKVDIFTHQTTLEELAKVKEELEFSKLQLNDVRLILSNPWHQTGYLVNAEPIQKIVDRQFGGS